MPWLRDARGFRTWQAVVSDGADCFLYDDGELRRMTPEESERYGWKPVIRRELEDIERKRAACR
jgi:hypothetical protein